MPVRQVPGTDLHYALVCHDKAGRERPEAGGALLGDEVAAAAADPARAVSDVFFLSHGWKGDVPAAIDQYDRWIGAMAAAQADRAEMRRRRPHFRPLLVGLHWPSQPWGDESHENAGSPGATPGLLSDDGAGARPDERAAELSEDVDVLVDRYADRVADTPAARQALRTIFEAARRDPDPGTLPPDVIAAYRALDAEATGAGARPASGTGDPAGAPPGADREAFDPEAIYQEDRALEAEWNGDAGPGLLGGGGGPPGFLLSPLRQLSFWQMKDRARAFGESGAHALVRRVQQAAPGARVHLMGHSFGCIVVSAAVAGPPGGSGLARPVDSLFLVQGALSLWSYCASIPHARGTPGYFHRIVRDGLVAGPVVTTRSEHDTAVGRYYPLGAQVARQLVLADDLPKYGGVGSFGAQGLGALCDELPMGPDDYHYGFFPARVYNLEASRVIARRDGASGAHSDIAHPEVAHAAWAAAMATI